MKANDQPSLFSVSELSGSYHWQPVADAVEMGGETLHRWKQRVFQYQQRVECCPAMEQASLFDLAPKTTDPDPDSINPFTLPQQNTEFWRWKADDQGVAALYFVIDYDLPLLLYVGETVKSNQRWKGEHDCKRYLLNYRQAHYRTQQASSLGIAFWPKAPAATRPRQQLESALIYKWRSPFNKENWEFWGTPFIGAS